MRKSLLSAAIGLAMSSSRRAVYPLNYHGDPCEPVSPTVSKERKCAQCKIGIVTGTHCFGCSRSRKK